MTDTLAEIRAENERLKSECKQLWRDRITEGNEISNMVTVFGVPLDDVYELLCKEGKITRPDPENLDPYGPQNHPVKP